MGWRKHRTTNTLPEPQLIEPELETGELHFCCICGALLGFDPEDEINGEGWGKDVCGACNRTRNDDSITMGW